MKKRFVAGAIVAALVVSALVMPSSSGAVKAGTSCKKAGLQTTDSGRKFTCVKQGKKFVWNKGVVIKAAPAANPSPSAIPSASPSATPSPTPTPSYTTLYKAVKATELVCQKGKVKKTVIGKTCPTGYKKISSKTVTTFVETKVLVSP